MKQTPIYTLIGFLIICIGVSASTQTQLKPFSASGPSCGFVYDGIGKGSRDIQHQTNNHAIGGHWTSFGPEVLHYEWAVISQHVNLPVHPDFGRCFKSLQVQPDIQEWTKVAGNERSAVNKQVKLKEGHSYRVLVRAIYESGESLTSVSNGVTIVAEASNNHHDLPKEAFSSFAAHSLKSDNGAVEPAMKVVTKEALVRGTRDHIPEVSQCPSDDVNQCRNVGVSVSEKLGETYGKPQWGLGRALLSCLDGANAEVDDYGKIITRKNFQNVPGGIIVGDRQGLGGEDRRGRRRGGNDDDNDDDDDNSYPWIIAPIVGGTLLICCCLLLLVLLALLLVRGVKKPSFSLPKRSPNRDSSEFPAFAQTEKEKKGYGLREEVGPGNVDSETRVEFPDTQVRRLSISHADGPESVISETHSPRRKHPIMSSTSSSFRDYHSVN